MNRVRAHHPGPLAQGVALVLLLVLCFSVAALGGAITATTVNGWYQTLEKPWFTPPDPVFGIVWTALYGLMAFSAFVVWRRAPMRQAKEAWLLFALQLAVNLLWSALFFGQQRIGLALIDAVLLVVLVAATAVAFARVSRLAAWLLAPYIAWGCFAVVLNGWIWMANP
jgi:benzodiazapine receptor